MCNLTNCSLLMTSVITNDCSISATLVVEIEQSLVIILVIYLLIYFLANIARFTKTTAARCRGHQTNCSTSKEKPSTATRLLSNFSSKPRTE